MRPRDAVRDRRGAAGIGGEIAADGAGAFRGEELRIQLVDRGSGLARALQRDAGLAGDGVGGRIDLADPVEPVERQYNFVVMRNWPPTRPVLPPCGTMGVAVSLASLRIAATSATVPGRNTIGEWPRNKSRTSTR